HPETTPPSIPTNFATAPTWDWKRNAGATRLNERRATRFSERRPGCIRGRARFPCIDLGANQLYFLPDAALVVGKSTVTALSYQDLRITQREVQFIEDGSVPRDAQVVGHTWRYVNKKGGPDRRFNNNRQLPICLYSELDLESDGGLNGRLHLSEATAGTTFVRVVEVIGTFLASTETPKIVTAWKRPKRWPTVVFALVASIFFAVSLIPNVPRESVSFPQLDEADRVESATQSKSSTGSVEPGIEASAAPIAESLDESLEVGGPLVILPPEATPESMIAVPTPRLRPRQQ
ncbi:MAG: hypothetical protein WD400_02230, partial [Pontimonas sp.]